MGQQVFKPEPPLKSKPTVTNLRLEFTPEKAAQIREAAARHGCSMRSFCSQAIDFALASMAQPTGSGDHNGK